MDGSLWNRWEYFSWVGFRDVNKTGELSSQQSVESGVSGFKYGEALNEIEGILIEIIEPKLNKQGGKLSAAKEYFQWVDPDIEDVTNKDILDKIEFLARKINKQD
jgi:hypothetical protein